MRGCMPASARSRRAPASGDALRPLGYDAVSSANPAAAAQLVRDETPRLAGWCSNPAPGSSDRCNDAGRRYAPEMCVRRRRFDRLQAVPSHVFARLQSRLEELRSRAKSRVEITNTKRNGGGGTTRLQAVSRLEPWRVGRSFAFAPKLSVGRSRDRDGAPTLPYPSQGDALAFAHSPDGAACPA